MALVAMMLSFSVSSCSDDDDNFIPVDYSQDLVGTWTCLEADFAEALVISADGSVVSTGLKDGDYWENVNGKVEVKNNKIKMQFEDGDKFEGRFEMIPGEKLFIVKSNTGEELTYSYCKKDLSKEIIGQWVCTQSPTGEDDDMIIQTFQEDGKTILTGRIPEVGDFVLNVEAAYNVFGNLLIVYGPNGVASKVFKLEYTLDGTAYGDIMMFEGLYTENNEKKLVKSAWLRVKQTLNLANQKYDYIKTYVTNVKGLDKDIPFMGYTFNFAKMTSAGFDKFLKTILFAVEFPDANTIKYSCVLEGTPMSMECPIEVDGNKMTVKMSERYAAYRDIDFYTYQDKDDSQMHMYMPTYTFENFFSNFQVGVMAERGELDLNDDAAVEAVHKSIADAVETINVSFIMSKSK